MQPIKVFVFGQWHDATWDEVTNLVYFNGMHASLECFNYMRLV